MQVSRWAKLTAIILTMAGAGALAQTPRWVTTQRWIGTGSQQTEQFLVNGSPWRVRYNPTGRGFFQIAVYGQDGVLLDMAATQERPVLGKGTATLRGRGMRYLGITGLDSIWEVTVEQYVTPIEEWHLTQLLKQPPPHLLKIGIWTGEDGQSAYTFTVPSESWQIRYSHSGEGLLQIIVENDEGFVGLAANQTVAAEGTSWVHRSGTFTVKVASQGLDWRIEVLAAETPGGG